MIRTLTRTWKQIKREAAKIHRVSDTLRFPVFNTRVVGRAFGLQLAGVATALSIVTIPTHAFDYNVPSGSPAPLTSEIVMTTESQYTFPLERTIGMSQSFHALHPGLDLRAPRGTFVLAMDEGTVVEVEQMLVGYGHFVRIAHNGTLSTLYAHLDKVQVAPGDKVARGQTIGTVGLTGWTTGPHLHFEIHVADRAVNPLNYIGVK
jgi:murein DD-endopeptidase MepM/ murein hydrolase activator NlpD